MTLFRRILLYYVLTLSGSLAVVGFVSWIEFGNQLERMRTEGLEAVIVKDGPLEETMEILIYAGLPAMLVGVASGMILLRRALRPIKDLTKSLENTDVSNLSDPVPHSGNGDELDRMALVFNRMKKRLGLSFTQASEFTIHASHELKTPLTIIHGTLEQMLAEEAASGEKTARIESMLEEVQRLANIVGQLTFLATTDAGLLDAVDDDVELHELVKDLADEGAVLASGSGITVNLGECQPVSIRGNRARLRQLLLNLMDNAVKYNRPNGSVDLSLTTNPSSAVVTLTNTGPSLPPAMVGRVFERFFRGDAAHSRAIEGSGLGLSIARSIVEAHQGAVCYETHSDDRTKVTVELPIQITK
jgi:signal transduction histidine kinase